MLLHLTNRIHDIRLHPCVYTFENKYKRSKNLFRHRGQTPDTRLTNICSSEEISRKQSTAMTHEQATIYLDSSSHASEAAKPAPFTTTVPKKPFKSKTATSDQTDYGKTPQKEKTALLHFVVLKKRFKLRGKR